MVARASATAAYPSRGEDDPYADREDRRQGSPGGVADEGHRAGGLGMALSTRARSRLSSDWMR